MDPKHQNTPKNIKIHPKTSNLDPKTSKYTQKHQNTPKSNPKISITYIFDSRKLVRFTKFGLGDVIYLCCKFIELII